MIKLFLYFCILISWVTLAESKQPQSNKQLYANQLLDISNQIVLKLQAPNILKDKDPDLDSMMSQFSVALQNFKKNGGDFSEAVFHKKYQLLKIISTGIDDKKFIQNNSLEKLKSVDACQKFQEEEIPVNEKLTENIYKNNCHYYNYGSKEIVGFFRNVSGTKMVENFSLFGVAPKEQTFVKLMNCLVPLYEKKGQLYEEIEGYNKDLLRERLSFSRPEMRIAKESTDDTIVIESYLNGHWFKNHTYKNCGPKKNFFKNYILPSIYPLENNLKLNKPETSSVKK